MWLYECHKYILWGDFIPRSNRNKRNKVSQNNRSETVRKKTTKAKPQIREEAPFPHFRHHLKGKHPALVTGEIIDVTNSKNDKYLYRTVTHEPRHKRRNNEAVIPNPNKSDKKPMYIIKRQRNDIKDNFALKPLPWAVPDKLKK